MGTATAGWGTTQDAGRSTLPLARIETIDALLDAHAAEIGRDMTLYRHHAYRVANLALFLAGTGGDTVEKVAIAAALHDIGIWTERTFDYLDPSERVATAHLARTGRTAWTAEVVAMIAWHHKATPCREYPMWLVEPFRRADWIDVTRGAFAFGVPRRWIADLYRRWPGAGFHRRLVRLTLERARRHPLSPLPMLRL